MLNQVMPRIAKGGVLSQQQTADPAARAVVLMLLVLAGYAK
jgi:hypothetical protein